MSRHSVLSIFTILSLLATLGYAVDRSESETTPVADRQGADAGELDGADDGKLRLREGMKLTNLIGELHELGGRIEFRPDGEAQRLLLLENLALERVSQDLDQKRKWSVSGVVTEFKGGNYLLLSRAVLKARASTKPGPRS